MSPLDQIESGILSQNWTLVIEGYNLMTGKNLAVKLEPKRIFIDNVLTEVKPKRGRPKKVSVPDQPLTSASPLPNPPVSISSADGLNSMLSVHDSLEIEHDNGDNFTRFKKDEPDTFEKFRIQMNPNPPEELDEDGRKKSRPLPFDFKAGKKNSFVDDGTLFTEEIPQKEYKEKMEVRARAKERRPEQKFVKKECATCHQKIEIDKTTAFRYANPDETESSKPFYYCDKCLRR